MSENMQTETFSIKGMRCKSCVDRIEYTIRGLEGVKAVNVDLLDEKATVTFDPQYITIDVIKKTVVSLGYTIGADKIETQANLDSNEKNTPLLEGITYGLIPHIGCIAFIIGSILGVTFLTSLFKSLLLNQHFFYVLLLISVGFATVSSVLYLHKNGLLSWVGAKKKWKYLAIMYGTTVGVNLLMFLFIFPILANIQAVQQPITTATFANAQSRVSAPTSLTSKQQFRSIYLEVSIPCPGHAPLITSELKRLEGILNVRFDSPNKFYIEYDDRIANKDQILGIEVFKTYPAKVISEKVSTPTQISSVAGCGCCASGGDCCDSDARACSIRS